MYQLKYSAGMNDERVARGGKGLLEITCLWVVPRDVNRLSIIRNSIEKTDYRLRIDVIDNRKLP